MKPAHLALAALLSSSLVGACGERPPRSNAAPLTAAERLNALVSLGTEVEYTEVSAVNLSADRQRVAVVDRWSPPTVSGEVTLYEVTTTERGPDGAERVRERARYELGPEGWRLLGTEVSGRPYVAFEPPQVVLPPDPKVGAFWTGTHRVGDTTRERSCSITPSSACEGGLVSDCVTAMGERAVKLQQHYCPGLGWVGYTGEVELPGGALMYLSSESARRDGRPLPAIPEG
ncbi:hypothetical protein L6R49_21305 [Myxococcota bacterium]|nr:hypothetical protein [Myxococcota bacterium]